MHRINLFTINKRMSEPDNGIEWLREMELIPRERWCGKHKKRMTYIESKGSLGFFRCFKLKKYDHCISVANDTWFENCHLSYQSCIIITYAFAWKFSYEQTQQECSIIDNETVSTESISDRFSLCRGICTLALERNYKTEGLIGGPGVIVEIDECKIGRRKFERGRLREGVWVLGMIEREGRKYRVEICPDNKRDETTLLTLIKKHVALGTEIHTDCWRVT